MLNFDFSDKGLGVVSPAYFMFDFLAKIFLMLYSINWHISLSGCLYVVKYWEISVLQLFVNQAVTSWIFLDLLFCFHFFISPEN